MKKLKVGFILSIIAILCFLFVGTGKAISAEKTIRIGSPFKPGTSSLMRLRSSRN